jgi:hypothetical protein
LKDIAEQKGSASLEQSAGGMQKGSPEMEAETEKILASRGAWSALLISLHLLAGTASADEKRFDVKAFGTKGDGEALDTASIYLT